MMDSDWSPHIFFPTFKKRQKEVADDEEERIMREEDNDHNHLFVLCCGLRVR